MGMRSNYRGELETEVTIKREELLERLQRNRAMHRKEHELAMAAWREDLAFTLQTLEIASLKVFPEELARLQRDCPVSHDDEYDRVIDMFSMSVKEEVRLDTDSFNRFCRDEWGWKTNVRSNVYYRAASERR